MPFLSQRFGFVCSGFFTYLVAAPLSPSTAAAAATDAPTKGPAQSKTTRSLVLVTALLAPTLGGERAGMLVRDAATSLDLGSDIDLNQALVLLEQIAGMPGVTGIAARFAKTRVHLSW